MAGAGMYGMDDDDFLDEDPFAGEDALLEDPDDAEMMGGKH